MPAIDRAFGFTGKIGPVKPAAAGCAAPGGRSCSGPRWRRSPRPIAGCSSRPTERASARSSRSAITFWVRSVAAMSNSRLTSLPSSRRLGSKPASRNTRIMAWFSASTTASNRCTPSSRPISTRCSSNTEPMPRPWWASATTNATSASRPAGSSPSISRSNRPTAMISPASQPASATRLHVVDVAEPDQVPLRDRGIGREVAQVAGPYRQPGVEPDQRVGVVRGDRPQVHGATVGHHHVGFPGWRVVSSA